MPRANSQGAIQRESQFPASQAATQSQSQAPVIDPQEVIKEGHIISQQRLKKLRENLDSVQEQLKDVASTLADDDQTDKVQGLRESSLKVVHMEHQVQAYLEAMESFFRTGGAEGYEPDATKQTDFRGILDQAAADLLQSSQVDLQQDQAVQDFDRVTGNIGRPGGANGESQGGLGDDDIVMEGGHQELLNNRCPLTQKSVMELDLAVEDQFGYIYENEAIRATLANCAQRGMPCMCPIAGTTHQLRGSDLRPSERVRRAKRRAMLQRPSQAGNTQQQQDDVYDV